ncbi:MAG: YihY/virulence factor BrkB family protein, partial [Acidimicrobiia bacterium]|nr:YihY/virulence factor BrkB family protein [Acidimicrobiia bacterium]
RLGRADVMLYAAAVAFNSFFALVPLLLVAVAAASFLGRDLDALDRTMDSVELFAPVAVTDVIRDVIIDVESRLDGRQTLLVVVGVLAALFIGSRAVLAMQRALARVEGQMEHRPMWEVRLTGVGLTLAAGSALVGTTFLLVLGGAFSDFIENKTGIGLLATMFELLRIPLASLGLFVFLRVFYHWGPPEPLPAAGTAALVATTGTVGASLLFGWYLSQADEFGTTVGALGGFAFALLWLYVGALATIVGAALVTNAWRYRETGEYPAVRTSTTLSRP